MKITNHTAPINTGVLAVALGIGLMVPMAAHAGRWSFSINVPGQVYWHHSPNRVYYHNGYYPGYYYPNYNPVVERDVYDDGHFHGDGTYHGERTVEDRHDSFYSPGRNEAITRPRTTVERYGGPGYANERERTSWIGSDGRPHSTTVDRVTTVDPWGNTQTDTHVTLKNKKAEPKPETENEPPVEIKIPGGNKTPKR